MMTPCNRTRWQHALLPSVVAVLGHCAGPAPAAPLPMGAILTVAGSGTAPDPGMPGWLLGGSAGNSGAATSSQLSHPSAVVFDIAGNLLITDTGNRQIRQINSDGTIKKAAGLGAQSLAAD